MKVAVIDRSGRTRVMHDRYARILSGLGRVAYVEDATSPATEEEPVDIVEPDADADAGDDRLPADAPRRRGRPRKVDADSSAETDGAGAV